MFSNSCIYRNTSIVRVYLLLFLYPRQPARSGTYHIWIRSVRHPAFRIRFLTVVHYSCVSGVVELPFRYIFTSCRHIPPNRFAFPVWHILELLILDQIPKIAPFVSGASCTLQSLCSPKHHISPSLPKQKFAQPPSIKIFPINVPPLFHTLTPSPHPAYTFP